MAECSIKPIKGVLPDTVIKSFDPIQGLVDFTLDIKPYHTKIVEILVEYIHVDEMRVSVAEKLEWVINLLFPSKACRYWFDTSTNTLYRRVYYTTRDFDIVGVSASLDYFTFYGNYSVLFPPGASFEVDGSSGNDGFYFVRLTTYDISTNTTNIYVVENITSNTVKGIIRQITPSVYFNWLEIPATLNIVDPALSTTVYRGDYWVVQDPAATTRLYIRNSSNTAWIPLEVVLTDADPLLNICGIQSVRCDEFGFDEMPYDGVLGEPISFNIESMGGELGSPLTTGPADTFIIDGDQTEYFTHAQPFVVEFSSNNDGRYHVYKSEYVNGKTVIYVHQDINTPGGSPLGQITVDDNILVYGSPFTLGYDESSNDCVIEDPPRNVRCVIAERLEITVITGEGSPVVNTFIGWDVGLWDGYFDLIE